jgi:flagellar basal body rod protein FlgG
MIAAQRAYQISARLIQVADENEQTINGLGK